MKIHPKRLRWINRRLLWVLGGFLVLIIVFAGMQLRKSTKVKSLKVQIAENELNLQFVREEDVRDIIFRTFGHYLEGQQIGDLDVQAIEESLEKDLFVRQAQVYIDIQANANVVIEQREPVLRVRDAQDKNDGYYLDKDGNYIPASQHYTARVMVLTGDVGVFIENFKEIEAHRLNKVFPLVDFILKNPFWKAQIEQIYFEPSGEVSLVPKLGDHVIKFGKPDEEIAEKFIRLKTFYNEGLARYGWEKYHTINIAYKDQVVCKRR